MRRLKNWMSAVLALTMTAFAATAATATTVAGCAEDAPAMSAKTYVPEKVDLVDYYGGGGDVDGGGFTTFAHAGLLVPFEGTKVEMETQFKLLSKKTVEEGGDNVDGWVTYSFPRRPHRRAATSPIPISGAAETAISCISRTIPGRPRRIAWKCRWSRVWKGLRKRYAPFSSTTR